MVIKDSNLLDDYVYKNLNRYGNTVIHIDELKQHGKSKILEDLKLHGFNCNIRTLGYDRVTGVYPDLKYNEKTVIIEVIKDE